MKRSKKALTMTAMIAAAMLTACHETVYGPPPEELYGPPPEESYSEETIDPVETVYGPPEYFGYSEEPELEITPTPITLTPEPAEPLYGPPPDQFKAEENIEEDVYGPPSWFGEEEELLENGDETENSAKEAGKADD